jgi:hypothetical protein
VTSCPFCGDAANKGARLAKVVAKVWGLPAGRPSRATTTLTASLFDPSGKLIDSFQVKGEVSE